MDDEIRRRSLRRMKIVATGLLVAVTGVFLVARAAQERAAWIGYVRAGAEAAMVGALADWFAVTALFRHPLGLPIPHTAIIPRRKDQIGRSLGAFVQGEFLQPEMVVARLDGVDVASRAGHWLAHPAHAERAAEAVADALRGALEVLDDAVVQEALQGAVERRLRATPTAPLMGRAIDVAVDGGHHQRLLDAVLLGLRSFLMEHRATFRERLATESPWWVPEPIDERIFAKIFDGVLRFLADVGGDESHEVRRAMDDRIVDLARRLRDDPVLVAKGEELKEELLAHRDVQAWLAGLWRVVKDTMVHASDDPTSELRRRLAFALSRLGERLAADEELQAKVDTWVRQAVLHVVSTYGDEVGELIESTVARWDAEETSRKLELQVGRDLQFIRINGTVVGGLAGLVIHAVGETLF